MDRRRSSRVRTDPFRVFLNEGYVFDSGGIHMRSHVGRAPPPAAGPLAGLPVGGPGRPPRSRGTAPQSCCRSDYLSQAHSPFLNIPYDARHERLFLAFIAGLSAFGLEYRPECDDRQQQADQCQDDFGVQISLHFFCPSISTHYPGALCLPGTARVAPARGPLDRVRRAATMKVFNVHQRCSRRSP